MAREEAVDPLQKVETWLTWDSLDSLNGFDSQLQTSEAPKAPSKSPSQRDMHKATEAPEPEEHQVPNSRSLNWTVQKFTNCAVLPFVQSSLYRIYVTSDLLARHQIRKIQVGSG